MLTNGAGINVKALETIRLLCSEDKPVCDLYNSSLFTVSYTCINVQLWVSFCFTRDNKWKFKGDRKKVVCT